MDRSRRNAHHRGVTEYIQANTNGRLHSADRPSISPLDRGFLYGDAIYEVWRTYDGVIHAWEEHWQRLEQSARALDLTLPLAPPEMLAQIRRTASAWRRKAGATGGHVGIRLQITRGGGAIGLNPRLADHAHYVILVQALTLPPPAQFAAGIRLSLATALHRNHPEALNPAWKTGNYLNNILCLREALARGAEEVVMTNLAGEITESSVSNIFFVRDGVLYTPPLSAGILAGITRAAILGSVASSAGVRVCEIAIRPEALDTFSECFLTGTRREIHPVQSIDEVRYTVGANTITVRLQQAFADYTRDYAQRNQHLRVLRY